MHERPELHHIILKRRACKQESALSIEAQKGLPALALKVFDVLSLIEDHVVPLFATECKMVLDHQLIRLIFEKIHIFIERENLWRP
jgi:hypothetical protein